MSGASHINDESERVIVRISSRMIRLVTQPLRRLTQLPLRPPRVSSSRVQVLVTENLSEANEIVVRIDQELVGHRVAKKVRMQFDSGDRRILVAK